MAVPVCRLGDGSDHGGQIISAAGLVQADGLPVARIGDSHWCPIEGHGVTSLVSGSSVNDVQGQRSARVGDQAGCGAVLTEGSPTVSDD